MSKTVLIVDDSASIRQVSSIALKGAGYEVLEAADGKAGLAKLDGRKVNLIITDINMPVMDGITFIKEVRKLSAYRFTPIMVLTTESEEKKKAQGREAGAKAWVIKPFQPAQILDAVSKLILP
ncbi:two-component system, chemotaxis family, chemotaxis protein CheY [Gammaproteobacteria bacterium]